MAANGSQFEFVSGKPIGSVLIVPLLSVPKPALNMLGQVDQLCEGAVSELLESGAIHADAGPIVHTTRAGAMHRVIVVNMGKAAELTGHKVRVAGAQAARWLMNNQVEKATLWIDDLAATDVEEACGAFASGMTLGGWSYRQFTTRNSTPPALIKVAVCGHEPSAAKQELATMRDAQMVADAANYCRSIAHQPPNVITPKTLAAEAKKLAAEHKLKLTVIDAAKAKQLGMEGLLSVGKGAADPACLIIVEYRPLPKTRTLTALVGKAITFDTGGYSIKPAANMEAMKFDKCGGCTVLGILKAAATLRLSCNLVGVIAAAENAVSAEAYKPADILRMYSGKTVEITNTDAEGRLVLADALWYAQQHLEPTRIIDFATLTGGVIVALGDACAGLMSNHDRLAEELGESGRATHERVWRLPLWDDYVDLIKGTDADLKNSSTKRHAHAIVGGIFLKQFVKSNVPWAHLDIAGVAHDDDGNSITGKGATGFGVRLMVDYLRRYAS